MLFIAGVEGTGHHLFYSLFQKLSTTDNSIHMEYYDNHPLPTCFRKCEEKYLKGESLSNKCSFNVIGYTHIRIFICFWKEMGEEGYEHCVCMAQELQKASVTLANGSLLYMRSYSYPSGEVHMDAIPDLRQLVQFAQNETNLPYIFDLKVIVMKRRWSDALISACRRFGKCLDRSRMLPYMLSELQDQLSQIGSDFWILLDFNDLVQRPVKYTDILSRFLNIHNRDALAHSLSSTVSISQPTSSTFFRAHAQIHFRGALTKTPNLSFQNKRRETHFFFYFLFFFAILLFPSLLTNCIFWLCYVILKLVEFFVTM
ncbi:hypothetical protein RFI_20116 [Reticulomyxa filosa]|uniref:Sulfotransferase domain-containing protein n=1 Tax=Reticulomyxa filosa TaxID=46433 RepID=X6MT96_RETFI|nr:hypothetical protein RFI_20116 [Reticulomyxa filosa]|eukprot:ETO17213.1 hypothetical protein RFI_20116 [Reticulomyxa filosa]